MALRVLWSLQAVFGGHFRVSVVSLGTPWATLGPPGDTKAIPRLPVEPPQGVSGRPWATLGTTVGTSGPLLVSAWASQASLGVRLGVPGLSWTLLGAPVLA